MTRKIRTRIAPSPTGFLHLGTARTALFSWAFARHFGGDFILRVEDTDVARSTQAAVEQIIDALRWLQLDYDEGPYFQMQRVERHREVIGQMLADGNAYRCWCTPAELDAMRAAQRERGEKPRYDGRWRPAAGKALPAPPEGIAPVVRFRNPVGGGVTWNDMVKGPITIANAELDDLIIARPASDAASADASGIGVPTYNFCVVVDDWDMQISHVIRGDDHVNNTPRQINILRALGVEPPVYGHLPMILGPDGDKLSKRHGAVSVTQYRDDGYLPEAMVNYLARLGWSHGDVELFSREQLVEWFDGNHLSRSAAQWDIAKLNWVNAQAIKHMPDASLALLAAEQLQRRGIDAVADERLQRMCALFKDRCITTVELADWLAMYFVVGAPQASVVQRDAIDAPRVAADAAADAALQTLADKLEAIEWNKAGIGVAIRATLATHGLKMPQFAPAVRLRVCGRAQTPSLDAVLELFPRASVLARLRGCAAAAL